MVAFSDVRNAFDFVSSGRPMAQAAYLNVKTGATYWQSDNADLNDELPADIDTPGRYIAIPHKTELGLGKSLVLQFAAAHLPAQLEQVREIFSHPGAYARFKDLLAQQDMLEAWHTYEQNWSDAALRQWCTEYEIALED